MTFYIGQKVVCIASCCAPRAYGEVVPAINRVLTIRDIVDAKCWPSAGLRFHEIVNSVRWYADVAGEMECVFDSRRFRPMVERKTDISIFQNMLTDDRVTA